MSRFAISSNLKVPKAFSNVRDLDDSSKREMLGSLGVDKDAIDLMLEIDTKIAKLKAIEGLDGGPSQAWGAGCGGTTC